MNGVNKEAARNNFSFSFIISEIVFIIIEAVMLRLLSLSSRFHHSVASIS